MRMRSVQCNAASLSRLVNLSCKTTALRTSKKNNRRTGIHCLSPDCEKSRQEITQPHDKSQETVRTGERGGQARSTTDDVMRRMRRARGGNEQLIVLKNVSSIDNDKKEFRK